MVEGVLTDKPRKPVLIQWQLSSFFGWGVYGLNLAINWMHDPELTPISPVPFSASQLAIDGVRRHLLAPMFAASINFQKQLQNFSGQVVKVDVPVLQGLGNSFRGGPAAHNTRLVGKPTIGMIFFEDTNMSAQALEFARQYPLIVTGSAWNRQVLEGYGLKTAVTVIQGIDHTLFHPAPRAGFYQDRFLIFSGGKLEFRKGQDLALLAFKAFVQRHPEALLVTAWHSPWPKVAGTLAANPKVAPVPYTDQGKIDVLGWARANDVPTDKVIDLGEVPNALMPPILREMDVALFPNRGEGGTNLVAMEAMACGLPCILSLNTGHHDIADPEACFPLARQAPIDGHALRIGGTDGWGESDVEEAVEALEAVWRDREAARARGLQGAAKLGKLTWASQTRELREVIRPFV